MDRPPPGRPTEFAVDRALVPIVTTVLARNREPGDWTFPRQGISSDMKKRGLVAYVRFHDEAKNDMENPMLKKKTMLDETFTDEPIVGTRRNGESVQLADGYHRLPLAKLLDIEDAPIFLRSGRRGDVRGASGSAFGPHVIPRRYRWYASHFETDVSRSDQFEVGVTT